MADIRHHRTFDTKEEAQEARRIYLEGFPPQGHGSSVLIRKMPDGKFNCEFRRYSQYD